MMDSLADWGIPFLNDGGPMLVIPRELLPYWRGGDGPPVSDALPFGIDYARACQAAYPSELLRIGPGVGMVFGAEGSYPVQWLRLSGISGLFLVAWDWGEEGSESILVDQLLTGDLPWERSPIQMRLKDGELILLHAAGSGSFFRELAWGSESQAVICDGLPARLGPGEYVIDRVVIGSSPETDPMRCWIWRWTPVLAGGILQT